MVNSHLNFILRKKCYYFFNSQCMKIPVTQIFRFKITFNEFNIQVDIQQNFHTVENVQ